MLIIFVTVDKHPPFKSFIRQTTSTRLVHSSSNAEKPFVSIGQLCPTRGPVEGLCGPV